MFCVLSSKEESSCSDFYYTPALLSICSAFKYKTGQSVQDTFLSPLLSILQPPEETQSGDIFSRSRVVFFLCGIWVELTSKQQRENKTHSTTRTSAKHVVKTESGHRKPGMLLITDWRRTAKRKQIKLNLKQTDDMRTRSSDVVWWFN